MKRLYGVAAACACCLLAGSGQAGAAVVINEIMYNSIESSDVEYIELYNTGPLSVDLTGWYLLDNDLLHPRCYLVGPLNAGAYLVAPGLTNLFAAKYPWVTNLNPNPFDSTTPGQGWSLSNGGDEVRLYDPSNILVDRVNFSDQAPWPMAADGNGPSLELYHPALDNGLAVSWGASINSPPDGTPGAQNSVYREDQPPRITSVTRSVSLPSSTDTVVVTGTVTDDKGLAAVELLVDEGAGYAPRAMWDDGLHGDGLAGDSLYGAMIAAHANGTVVRYYVSARDTLPQTSVEPVTAPADHFGYTVGYTPPKLILNEIVARNVAGIVDEMGQHEDWAEIKNLEPRTVDLGGFYLGDSTNNTRKWKFPTGTTLGPGQYLYVWCDSDLAQGPMHAGFKLSAEGGFVGLFDTMDHGNVTVHSLTYGLSGADVAFGFYPENSDAPEYMTPPTPGSSNAASALFSPICINEFLTSSAGGGVDDWVELYNRGSVAVDVGLWHISDGVREPLRYTFPPSTIIPPGGHLVVDELTLGFGFDVEGTDLIMLTHADGITGMDYFDLGPQTPDVTQGRLPDGTANWHFFVQPSPELSNTCPAGAPALDPVAALRFTSTLEFTWDAVAGAEDYDVVKGSLATLRIGHGNFTTAVTGCVENNSRDRTSWDAAALPPGGGYFYQIRAMSFSCLSGTYDEGSTSQSGERDAEIAASPSSCP